MTRHRPERTVVPVGVVACLVALGGLGPLTGCGSVEDRAAGSSAPVLVPDPPFDSSYAFTLYRNWDDTYELLYNSAIGSVEHVRAVQLNPGGTWDTDTFGEGRSSDEIALVEQARDDASTGADPCAVVVEDPGVSLCTYPGYSFLVRAFDDVAGDVAWIVADYHDNPAAARGTGDPTVWNPESIEGRFLTAGFTAVPIGEASGRYLVER